MKRRIIMTEKDRAKLQELINEILLTEVDGVRHVRALDAEMSLAKVLPSEKVPPDVITMHTEALLSVGDAEDEAYKLVYPDEADLSSNRISVMSPIGTAILGYREGDVIDWEVPDGHVAIHVKRIIYQPEAAGDE